MHFPLYLASLFAQLLLAGRSAHDYLVKGHLHAGWACESTNESGDQCYEATSQGMGEWRSCRDRLWTHAKRKDYVSKRLAVCLSSNGMVEAVGQAFLSLVA